MKNSNILLGFAVTALLLPGCKSFVEGYDVSPNSPSKVTPALLLSASEVATFATYSSNMARTTGSWVQQVNGTSFQSLDYGNYAFYENDASNDWQTIYVNALQNLNTIINDATYSTGNPHFVGIAKVLKAINLGVATDFWGDVPNSEALKGLAGEDSFNPKYDKQEDVIKDIQAILTSAIADLAKPTTENVLLPGASDMIYGGDPAMWTKAAWALKARYANRLSKKNASGSASDALSSLANAISSSAEDMNAQFDAGTGPNQWYAFEAARGGYVRMCNTFTNMLETNADPRLAAYCGDFGGDCVGIAPGSEDTESSYVGDYLAGSASTPVPMVTFVEMKFIEAEAMLRSGNAGGAATAHNAAVLASVQKVTGAAAPQSFIDAHASETSTSISLEKIMTQKHIALFGQFEAWHDWRRTNFPVLTPNSKGVIGSIPRRYPTCLNERVNNSNATVEQDLTKPVWWDM